MDPAKIATNLYKQIINMLVAIVKETETNPDRGYNINSISYISTKIAETLKEVYPEMNINVLKVFKLAAFGPTGNILIADKDEPIDNSVEEKVKYRKIIIEKGKQFLSGITLFQDILPLMDNMFQNYNGEDSPHDLAGENIPIECRIVFTAMLFDYIGYDMETMKRFSETYFDPKIIEALEQIVEEIDVTQERAGHSPVFPVKQSWMSQYINRRHPLHI